MYIFKNAFISIIRNKGRNILIGIIIMVIASSCAITLAIRNSALKIVNSYEQKYELEETITLDRKTLMNHLKEDNKSQEEMIEQFNNIEDITVDEINNYGNSNYIKNYYYYYMASMDATDLEEATDSLVKETTTTETETKITPPENRAFPSSGSKSTTTRKTTTTEKIFNEKAQNGAFKVQGYSSLESMKDFIDGKNTIVDGAIFKDFEPSADGYQAIISEELATLNELKVGDTITLKNPNNDNLTYDLVITGIYHEVSGESDNLTNMFTSSVNTIIVPSALVEKMMSDDNELSVSITPTFILKDKTVIDLFENEVREKGLSEYYSLSNNLDTIEGATKSISNVKNFATTFLIITLLIGAVVLLVINMINIRERKYEIGVLRTIGMKRTLVITEFMIELLIVASIGLILGAILGSTSSVKIANNLLATEINNIAEEKENIENNFGGKDARPNFNYNNINGIATIEQVNSINAVVDIKVLLELLGIGILLTIISSVSAGVAIARFSPLTILKERT